MSLIGIDHAYTEIADNFFISERTVVGHKSILLYKIGTKSVVSLLACAINKELDLADRKIQNSFTTRSIFDSSLAGRDFQSTQLQRIYYP